MRNKFGVKVGQVWQDNDSRQKFGERKFEVVELEVDYGPFGRAKCKILDPQKDQREHFHARLDRFNGTRRGYSLVTKGSKKAKKKAKKAKPKRKKR